MAIPGETGGVGTPPLRALRNGVRAVAGDIGSRVGRQLAVAGLGQGALLVVLALGAGLGPAGLLAGTAYVMGLVLLVARAVRRRTAAGEGRFVRNGLGPANLVTLARGVLIGGVTASTVQRFATGALDVPVLVGVATVALLLDGVDGQVARRTGNVTALGARFDMELDAFLVLVLSVVVVPVVGPAPLAIGLMRYAYAAAGWALPWLRGDLPTRYSAKAVAVVQGIVLVVAVSGLVPPASAEGLVAVALGLLIWSFAHDVVWLWQRRHRTAPAPAPASAATHGNRAAATAEPPSPGSEVTGFAGRWSRRRWGARLVTGLAALLVLGALALPRAPGEAGLGALQLPLEAVLGAALLLVLPARVSRVLATVAGGLLGLLTALAVLDFGFVRVLSRPFDPVSDWRLADSVVHLLTGSLGRAGAVVALAGFLVLVVALLVVVTLATRRVAGALLRRPSALGRVLAVLVCICVTSLALGAVLVPGVPIASADAAGSVVDRGRRLITGPEEQRLFAAACAADPLRDPDPQRLLSGLRGRDVLVVFVESYGRDALTAPDHAGPMAATLDAATRRLGAAGFSARSGYLTSPISGGGSWLAHGTLLSGAWVDSEERHEILLASERVTVGAAFRRAGWRTVGVLPGNTEAWPAQLFYGLDYVYDTRNLGYRGPDLGWASTPDQYTLSVLEQAEHGRIGRPPLFAQIALVSSHAPWPIIPEVIGWDRVGDGAVYADLASGEPRDAVWAKGTKAARTAYRRSLQYSLTSLVSWVETYGSEDTVLVVLGDHQAAPLLSAPGAGRDVPISVIAGDPAVLRRIDGWGWTPGMAPAPHAPVWGMDAFRDWFVAAYSG